METQARRLSGSHARDYNDSKRESQKTDDMTQDGGAAGACEYMDTRERVANEREVT